jgi:hypothetical protein
VASSPRETCGEAVTADSLGTRAGATEQVKVLRVGGTLLYIPAGWFSPYDAAPCAGRIQDLAMSQRIQVYVHPAGAGSPTAENLPITRLVVKRIPVERGRYIPPQADSPDALGWQQQGRGDEFVDVRSLRNGGYPYGVSSPSEASRRNGGGASVLPNHSSIAPASGLLVMYEWPDERAPQPRWRAMRLTATALLNWLMTKPGRRGPLEANAPPGSPG